MPRLKALCHQAREHGLDSLDPARDTLIGIGMELSADRKVTKNSLGVFDLSWQAEKHPEWPQQIADEVQAIRDRLQSMHNTQVRFLIWAGMGGSIEDKILYHAAGLLRGGPVFYALDSTDPAKLKAILQDMQTRSGYTMPEILRSTLVFGMALGMTSYEPVVNLEKLAALYEQHDVPSAANIYYLTLEGSLLDDFGKTRGLTRVPLQLDNGNSTSGRHSSPLTRGSLYPLAFANADLGAWISGTFLSASELEAAFKLASFLHLEGVAGRDQVTLLPPQSWQAMGLWSKQDLEESLGKSAELGIKLIIGEPVKQRYYHRVRNPEQRRVFLAIQRKRESHPDAEKMTDLRRAGYPMAIVTFAADAPLSRYMQFLHYVVMGIGYLREMNFVTQPGVELYKSIASEIYREGQELGGTVKTAPWIKLSKDSQHWRGIVNLSPDAYSKRLAKTRALYAELTFFGDLRYTREGQAMRALLDRAATALFRTRGKMPVDVYEGPAMNHSYHEMIIGHGHCVSTVIASERQSRIPALGYEPDYHLAQFLATKAALERRSREVIALTIKDMSEESLAALNEFFLEVAAIG